MSLSYHVMTVIFSEQKFPIWITFVHKHKGNDWRKCQFICHGNFHTGKTSWVEALGDLKDTENEAACFELWKHPETASGSRIKYCHYYYYFML